MSINSINPRGLTRVGNATAEEFQAPSFGPKPTPYPCSDGLGTVFCNAATAWFNGFALNVRAWASSALPAGDLYSVSFAIATGETEPGNVGCSIRAGIYSGCGIDTGSGGHGGVNAAPFEFVYQSGLPAPNTVGQGVRPSLFHAATDPSIPEFAFLLNAASPWPSPDSEGNEIGRVLFTVDQLPDDFSFVAGGSGKHPDAGGYRINCGYRAVVTAYAIGEVTPSVSPFMCVL